MTVKQHYVPNFILKNFASRKNELWILNKETGKYWLNKGGRDNRYAGFAQNNYLPPDVDDSFGGLELKVAPLIKTILKDARIGNVPRLSLNEKKYLCHFFLAQILRAPRVKVFGEELHSQAYYSMLQETPEAKADPDYPERAVFAWMTSLKLEYAVVEPIANAPLLVCDEPCVYSDERVAMLIAKDATIQLSECRGSETDVLVIDSEGVNKLNRETMARATKFVAGPTPDAFCIPQS